MSRNVRCKVLREFFVLRHSSLCVSGFASILVCNHWQRHDISNKTFTSVFWVIAILLFPILRLTIMHKSIFVHHYKLIPRTTFWENVFCIKKFTILHAHSYQNYFPFAKWVLNKPPIRTNLKMDLIYVCKYINRWIDGPAWHA